MANAIDHRVLVCGGRNYHDMRNVMRVLDALKPPPTLIIQGGAYGADACASEWAHRRNILELQFVADWKTHGRAAGPAASALTGSARSAMDICSTAWPTRYASTPKSIRTSACGGWW